MPIKLLMIKTPHPFIDSDGKKIKTVTLYNTIGYRNIGFIPDLKVRTTCFWIIQSTCLYKASSGT